jgi:hypothetical protein
MLGEFHHKLNLLDFDSNEDLGLRAKTPLMVDFVYGVKDLI